MSAGQDRGAESAVPGAGAQAPSEAELRAAYEAELSRITVVDMMSQAAVSLLNIAARRLGPRPGAEQDPGAGAAGVARDLEQVRDGIDGVRALLEILERRIPQEVRPLRDALSQLQMAYAAEVRGAEGRPQATADAEPAQAAGESGQPGAEGQQPDAAAQGPGPGPAEASGRLWVPDR
ncbi:MAG TPA: hypothetical protein VN772_06335 [Solirubrobacteraceae bacterium]|nr:hypothetical protein [Solirubrobacteraceae bacterium]